MHLLVRLAVLAAAVFVAGSAPAREMSQQELEDWFNDDSSARIAAVNEGQLVFLPHPPSKPVHHHSNTITLDDETVASGWAMLRQCHEHLDRVPATQIVFREDRIRDLKIVSQRGIGQAWVEGSSVQLRDIGPGARICLQVQSQVMFKNADGTYHVNSGPFMRRFLDGYYPMHVSMDVLIHTDKLRYLDITPAQQAGFKVETSLHEVKFDVWFEGRLKTLIRFTPTLAEHKPPA